MPESRKPPRRTPPKGRGCSNCGYPLDRTPTLTCPECGTVWSETRSDHEAALELSPASRVRFGLAALGWLVIATFIAHTTGVIPPWMIPAGIPISIARGPLAFWVGLVMSVGLLVLAGFLAWPAVTGRRTGAAEAIDEWLQEDS